MDYTRRHEVGSVTIDVSPTYTSTDLLTPDATPTRVTLPTIAKFDRSLTEYSGKWGTITIHSVTPTRADITHRRYGCGCFNYDAPHQPYRLTSLLLSHCRRNDQLLFSPEKGHIQDRQIMLPFPQQEANASHVSRLSLFPDPFRKISQATSLTQLSERDQILKSLKRSLYHTTGYKDMYKVHLISKNRSTTDIVQCEDVLKKTEEETSIETEPSDSTSTSESINEDDVSKEENDGPLSAIVMVSAKATQTDIKDLKLEFAKTYILQSSNTRRPLNPMLYHINQQSLDNQHNLLRNTTNSKLKINVSTQTAPPVAALVKKNNPCCSNFNPKVFFPPHLPSISCVPPNKAPSNQDDHTLPSPPVRVCFQLNSPIAMRFKAQLEFNVKYGESETNATRISKRGHSLAR